MVLYTDPQFDDEHGPRIQRLAKEFGKPDRQEIFTIKWKHGDIVSFVILSYVSWYPDDPNTKYVTDEICFHSHEELFYHLRVRHFEEEFIKYLKFRLKEILLF